VRRPAEQLLLAAALALAALPVLSDPFPQDDLKWLETMAIAAHSADYSGTFVYQYGNHVEISRITHVVDANGEHGRLESLDGARREIIRNNNEVWYYYGDNLVKMEGRGNDHEFPALLQDHQALVNISKNYRVRQDGEGRVAGFHAHAILFLPKDNLRYAHRMWADSVSGLLLKAEVLDERGAVVEQYSFTQLTLGGNIDKSWIVQDKPASGARQNVSARHREAVVAAHPRDADTAPVSASATASSSAPAQKAVSGWQVDAMPPGFSKVTEVRRTLHNHSIAIQMVYSDGLAGISVFIEENDNDEDDNPGLTSQGMIQIYSKMVGNHLVTVVGEVPPQTVIQIADSVRNGNE
jgi:sigma-E factor negative regulatory protein RseB